MFEPVNKKIGLDGKSWTKFSVSVWDLVKSQDERELGHPAMFPEELCKRLIMIYTHPGDTVLDPFMGSGSALVAAKTLARNGIGLELNKDYVTLANKRLAHIKWGSHIQKHVQSTLSPQNPDEQEITEKPKKHKIPPEREFDIFNDDCMKVDTLVGKETVQLILTSPPYWDILNQKRTADYKDIRNYGNGEHAHLDFGNIADYGLFITKLGDLFDKCGHTLKVGGHICIVVMDLRKKDQFYPFHSDLADEMKKRGYKFEDIIIWNRLREYNNLRSLGYPYVFRVNKIHEYILIFKKVK